MERVVEIVFKGAVLLIAVPASHRQKRPEFRASKATPHFGFEISDLESAIATGGRHPFMVTCHGMGARGPSDLPLCVFTPLRYPSLPFFTPVTGYPPKTGAGLRLSHHFD